MGLISWIIFGTLAGWVASLLTGTDRRQGCITNIIVGVIGAFLGGLIMGYITGSSFNFAFDFRSFIVAVLGSVLLLVITGAFRRR